MTKHETFAAHTPPFKARYGNFIGGAFGAESRALLREHLAGHRQDVLRGRPLRRRGHRAGARRRARRQGRLGQAPASPSARNILNKIADRMEENLELLARRRDLGQRQADPRDDRRRPAAGDRPFPLLRRLHPRPGRLDLRRSTTTPSPITSTSRSASSARSSRGTSRC